MTDREKPEKLDLDHLEQAARAAAHEALHTVRWFRIDRNVYWSPTIDGKDTCVPQSYADTFRDVDAEFIALASPSTVLALVARIRELEQGLGEACELALVSENNFDFPDPDRISHLRALVGK